MNNVDLRKSIFLANLSAQLVENKNSLSFEVSEQEFEDFKKSVDFDLIIIEDANLQKFDQDLVKSIAHAFDKGAELSPDIEKAQRDRSKLTQVTITDKNGHRRKVWVKPGDAKSTGAKKTGASAESKGVQKGDSVSYKVTKAGGVKIPFKGIVVSVDKDGKYAEVKNTIGSIDYIPTSELKKDAGEDAPTDLFKNGQTFKLFDDQTHSGQEALSTAKKINGGSVKAGKTKGYYMEILDKASGEILGYYSKETNSLYF